MAKRLACASCNGADHGLRHREGDLLFPVSIRKRIDDSDEEIRELRTLAADPKSARHRHLFESDIAFESGLRDKLSKAIGDWPYKRGKPREEY